jgi:hypothetical protein
MFEEIPTNCRYGYARVSSQSQENNSYLASQKQEFIQQGVPKKIFAFKLDPLLILLKKDQVLKN